MNWMLFWTILAQVALGTLSLAVLAPAFGFIISQLVGSVVRVLPKDNDVDEIENEILDRILMIGDNNER